MVERIVIYVPGTNCHSVDPNFIKAVGSRAKVVMCNYPATDKVGESSDQGAANLRRMVAELRAKYPRAELYAVGESQGGMVLAKAQIDDMLKGAILVGVPGFVKSRWPRYQHVFDFVSFDMPEQTPEMVDRILSGDVRVVPWFLKLAVTHPLLAIDAALDALNVISAHNYADDMPRIAGILLDNEDINA